MLHLKHQLVLINFLNIYHLQYLWSATSSLIKINLLNYLNKCKYVDLKYGLGILPLGMWRVSANVFNLLWLIRKGDRDNFVEKIYIVLQLPLEIDTALAGWSISWSSAIQPWLGVCWWQFFRTQVHFLPICLILRKLRRSYFHLS